MELGIYGVVSERQTVCEGALTGNGTPGAYMTESDLFRIADCYAAGAAACKKAGFDMVMLHFGHGLQVGQFLSPLTNRRTDRYGGPSFENRVRFPVMIIDRIREKVGRDLLIEVRISGTEYEPGGIMPEESIAFTRLIEDKIDLIQVSAGMHNPKWMTTCHPCGFLPLMPNVWLAKAFKNAGVKVPVAAIGGIQDLKSAEAFLADGGADVLQVCRGMLADPELVNKAYEGRARGCSPMFSLYALPQQHCQ